MAASQDSNKQFTFIEKPANSRRTKDLTGVRSGKLVVLRRVYLADDNHSAWWLCQCDCGKETAVPATRITNKTALNCGCLHGVWEDLTGRKFGRLTVIGFRKNIKGKGNRATGRWECRCDCGSTTYVVTRNLTTKGTVSCGCAGTESLIKRITIHGFSKIPEYKIWVGMIERCYEEDSPNYKYYGNCGIAVCQRWIDSFEAFFKDMGPRPTGGPRMTIERKDRLGNYCPENCIWATYKVQARNRRSNRLITVNGETKTVAEWCEKTGLKKNFVLRRLNKGWSGQDAITKPA